MEIEKYTITYKIGDDIPINPAWIREQLQAAVAKLQAEIDKKNSRRYRRDLATGEEGHGTT